MRTSALVLPLLLILPVAGCAGRPAAAWESPALAGASQAAPPPATEPAADTGAPGKPARTTPPAEPPARPAAEPAAESAAEPKPRPTTKRPRLPAGRVPDFLVGQWSGGFGSEDNRYLVITSDGRYERGKKSGVVESAGVVVAGDSTATFHDTRGGTEKATLTYTDAAGIIVLSVDYAEQGYYSYVPF